MKKHSLIRKWIAAGIIFLFVGVTIVQGIGLVKTTISNQYFFSQNNTENENTYIQSNTNDPVYSPTPDWISDSPHYSTGGAFADINNDGWLDFVVSDGNDMGEGHVRIYLNDGAGHLSTSASWQSADVAYNGHLDIADVNGDDWLDIAVSYLGTGSSLDPIARVYLNNNGVPSSTADWTANIIGNAFGVDFGDMNNDGRPDLAIATGWSYDSYHYHTYVYLNIDGSYGSSPSWVSDDTNIYMNVLWLDADDDGWLDLAGIADGYQTQIYRNLGGMLETTASWYTTDSSYQFGIMLTSGDVTGDGIRDLFATDNTQLGGDGYFKQYTGLSTGFFETTHSWEYYGGYGSAIALTDVNGDNTLDLATGAWWDNSLLFLNSGSSLPSTPSWNSQPVTVVEKIVFGDIGPELKEQIFTEQFTPSGDRRLFYLPHRQIQGIDTVLCDGIPLSVSEYTYSRDEGWITVSTTPDESLAVTYRYSTSQDMGITNWDSNIGNYLYYNQLEINNTAPAADFTWTPPNPKPDQTITFDASNSYDLDGTITLYEWDWDNDGTYEDYDTSPTVTYSWTNQGNYLVTLRVTDDYHATDTITKTVNVSGGTINFNIDITGGVGVTTVITNIGTINATNIRWSVTLTDGLILLGKTKNGTVTTLPAGNSVIVRDRPIFGFGKTTITVDIICAEGITATKSVVGTVILFFAIGVK